MIFEISSMFDEIFIFGGMILFIGMMANNLFMISVSFLFFSFDSGILIYYLILVFNEDSDDDSEDN